MLYADCRLRVLTPDDSARVLSWRNQDRVRAGMYSDHIITQDEHDRWFAAALIDATAAYYIFEHQDRPLGFVSFTGISRVHNRCTWAFYLGEADSPRGSGATMELLALDEAFGVIGIGKLCCEVFVFNAGVVRLHHRFGFLEEGRFVNHYRKNGEMQDIVCLARFAANWPTDRVPLMATVFEGASA
jgi:UDP-4-amino-4,6-dideoxy-N-acetyl-beta-L-altrosamine N-acetyltransferase